MKMKNFRERVTFLILIYCSSLVVQTWATMEIPVQLGGSVTLDCGFETTVTGRPLQWVTILPGKEPKPFAYSWEGASGCSEDDLCTLHPNGSLELHDISLKDVDRMYRCQIGDGEKYEYYSDHRLKVLVETCPLIKLSTATSAKGFKIDEQVMFSYTEPVCEDNAHGNYRATCYPPPGILMEGDYENIQCRCRRTDSACLTDRLKISVASTKMLKEKMQPLGIGLIIIVVVVVVAIAVFATYYITLRCHNKNKKRTEPTHSASEHGAVQPSDQTITEASHEPVVRSETDEVDSGNNRASASPVKPQPVQVSETPMRDDQEMAETSFKGATDTDTSHDNSYYDGDNDHKEEDPLLDSNDQNEVLTKPPAGDTKETTQVARTVSLWDAKTVKPHADNGPKRPCIADQDERPVKDEVDSGNNRASASPVKPHPVQTPMRDDQEMAETSFNGSAHEEEPLLDSNDQNEVLTKPPAAQMTVSLKDTKTVRPHADNGPKRPCIEYRIDESDGERSCYFEFEVKKPGAHLVLSTSTEKNSPSTYEIYFDKGKIRTSTEGKEGDSIQYDCGRFSMIMREEELSLSISVKGTGWIQLFKWEKQVYLNRCCFITGFNMDTLERCQRLTECGNPTSRTLSLHP